MFNVNMFKFVKEFTIKQACELLANEYPSEPELSNDQHAYFHIIRDAILNGELGDGSTKKNLQKAEKHGPDDVTIQAGVVEPINCETEVAQIKISKDEWCRWFSENGSPLEFLQPEESLTSPELPNGLDASVVVRLQAMIDAANSYWAGKTSADELPLNKAVSTHIKGSCDGKCKISSSLADTMASIIRPDWAKDRTWKDNKKR